jgi:hypothetical protein
MYMMVDRSGSLNGAPWSNLVSALGSFFNDSKSNGLTIGLRFFPLDDTCTTQDYTCTGSLYATPLGPWSALPDASTALVAAISGTDAMGCLTPTQEALSGLLAGSKTRQIGTADHQVIAVLLSDGSPCCGDCPVETASGLGQISGDFYTNAPFLRTYAVALASPAVDTMSAIAQKGGGQVYKTDGSSSAIVAALNDIRDAAVPCDFAAPEVSSNVVDLSTLEVDYYASGALAATPLNNVGSAIQCGVKDGWYWDNSHGEQRVALCRASCSTMRQDPSSHLALSAVACPQ